MKTIPDISKRAFWDVGFENLDFEKQKDYIVQKIFEYGSWNDMLIITRYYGKENTKQVLQKSKFYLPDAISFIATVFNINKEEMACSTTKPFRPTA